MVGVASLLLHSPNAQPELRRRLRPPGQLRAREDGADGGRLVEPLWGRPTAFPPQVSVSTQADGRSRRRRETRNAQKGDEKKEVKKVFGEKKGKRGKEGRGNAFERSQGRRFCLATSCAQRRVKSIPTEYPNTCASAESRGMSRPPTPIATTCAESVTQNTHALFDEVRYGSQSLCGLRDGVSCLVPSFFLYFLSFLMVSVPVRFRSAAMTWPAGTVSRSAPPAGGRRSGGRRRRRRRRLACRRRRAAPWLGRSPSPWRAPRSCGRRSRRGGWGRGGRGGR